MPKIHVSRFTVSPSIPQWIYNIFIKAEHKVEILRAFRNFSLMSLYTRALIPQSPPSYVTFCSGGRAYKYILNQSHEKQKTNKKKTLSSQQT